MAVVPLLVVALTIPHIILPILAGRVSGIIAGTLVEIGGMAHHLKTLVGIYTLILAWAVIVLDGLSIQVMTSEMKTVMAMQIAVLVSTVLLEALVEAGGLCMKAAAEAAIGAVFQ
jgi:hypothetical protein